jgi:peptide/nickel transport system permease protein
MMAEQTTELEPRGLGGDRTPMVGAAMPATVVPALTGRRRRRVAKIGLWLAAGWVVTIITLAILAPVLPIDPPDRPVGEARLGVGFRWPEPLGTDRFARSELSRIIFGSRQSLVISGAAVAVALVVGALIGTIAGYFRGWTDRVVSVFVDSFLALPPLIILLALTAALRPSTSTLVIGLGAIATPGVIRVARAQAINFSQRDYIAAARVMGASHARIMRRYIAPSLLVPLSTFAVILMSLIMIAEGSLSFLGVGVPPPNPSWGEMIASGQDEMNRSPHLVFVPGAVFLLTVVSLNAIGEWARQRGDRPSKAL